MFFPGFKIGPFHQFPKSDFGLDDSKFTFLFVFHMASIMERKNPFALIKAFKEAFRPHDKAALIIKTSFGSKHPEQFEPLKENVADANNRLVDGSFSRDEILV